jgi:hypothetical protein
MFNYVCFCYKDICNVLLNTLRISIMARFIGMGELCVGC